MPPFRAGVKHFEARGTRVAFHDGVEGCRGAALAKSLRKETRDSAIYRESPDFRGEVRKTGIVRHGGFAATQPLTSFPARA